MLEAGNSWDDIFGG